MGDPQQKLVIIDFRFYGRRKACDKKDFHYYSKEIQIPSYFSLQNKKIIHMKIYKKESVQHVAQV
jgi:hypothetical protein